jgi:hypothetical protein
MRMPETPVQEEQVGFYEPWQAIGDNWRPGVPAGTFYTDGIKALRRTGETTRDGVMATLEFRPSKDWTSTLRRLLHRGQAGRHRQPAGGATSATTTATTAG